MKRTLLLPVCISVLWAATSCHNNDPGPSVCKPHSLLFGTDSIVYRYNDNGRVNTVVYYVSGRQTKQDDLTYNSKGQLVTIAKTTLFADGSSVLDSYHTISYNDNETPASLSTDSYSGHFVTEFTHDEQQRLTMAETKSGFQAIFVGSTRYEYDDNGNIPKVYYNIDVNQQVKEVLARENLSFDDKEKYYANSPELKIANEYVYGYLPNKNNCLSAQVYYYSYAQHFSSPLSVVFTATYNDQGLIKSLGNEGTSTQLYSGEVLFNSVLYSCN